MTPKRIQLSRKKGWRLPENAVNIARPGKYGNPHKVGFCDVCGVEHTRAEAVGEFEAELLDGTKLCQSVAGGLEKLRGKDLACRCPLGEPCHGDVLLRWANR